MLREITIGQYFPGESCIHKLDARTKILLTIGFIIALFITKNPIGMAVGVAFTVAGYLLSGVPIRMAMKSLKPVVPIIIFTAILNVLFTRGDVVLFEIGPVSVTRQGLRLAAMMIVRIFCLIVGSSLLTYTTSPIELTDAIESLLGPLKRLHMPVHELAMMMTIALRFIPLLIEETDKIMSAQKARGADMESGGLLQRAKALIPVLVPLFVSSFRRADELALAMECRCYHGDEGRTRMKQLRYETRDFIAFAVLAALIVLVALLNRIFPAIY